ncbi:MAG: NAD-dependent epimerase/dehydratase family protein [archaeon]|nr:NAD-dependent epimerase/dehydratase family protein [archaeon]
MLALISGGSGFIGARLSRKLRENGVEVRDFSRPKGNVLDKKSVETAVKGCDVVFHLAAVLDEDNPLIFGVNVEGTKNILEASAKNSVKHFVFLGTAGIHGNPAGVVDEKTPLNPSTRYEKSKAAAEEIVLSYQEALPVTVVRSALVLGPNRYWKKIIEMIAHDTPMPGNGKNHWQVIYVDDLVDCLSFIALNEDAFSEAFIAAEQKPKTLREIVEFIRRKKGLNGQVKTMPAWLAKLLAAIRSFAAGLLGKKVFFTPEIIDRTVRERLYSTKKINSIGWTAKTDTFTALEKTLNELGKEKPQTN